MRPSRLAWALVFAAVGLVVSAPPAAGDPADPALMVVDMHVDLPWQVHFKGRSDDLREGHVREDALRAGGYGGIVLPIYLPDYLHKDGAHIEDAEAVLATIERLVAKNGIFLPLRSKQAAPGRVATFLAIEGAGAFAADPTKIDGFIERGVRFVGLVHAKNGPLASSATGERTSVGLTDVGKMFCNRVYDKGALVDVSHLSDAGFADLVPIAKAHGAPLVATHSNARVLAGAPRDLTDEQLRAIGDTGGVAGLNLHTPFLTKDAEAGVEHAVAQVEHMVKVAGIDHVAIGSDFDGGIKPPAGLDDAAAWPKLAAALRRRGMSYDDVLKIFSLNALRVLAWRPPATFARP